MTATKKKKKSKKAKAALKKQKKPKCRHCQSGPETYWYLKRQYIFDVDLAKTFVQDGREPVEVEDESVRVSVDRSRIYPEHLEHVDTKYPGIITHVWYTEPTGERLHGHLLIDGNHRAARCLQLGIPFYAHVLSEEESLKIVQKSPEMKSSETESA
jgi:hypothetical protein